MSRIKNFLSVEKIIVESGGLKGGWIFLMLWRSGILNGKQISDLIFRFFLNRFINSVWSVVFGIVGILNFGNICFMNVVIQCLSNIDWFFRYFIIKQYKDDMKSKLFFKKFVI